MAVLTQMTVSNKSTVMLHQNLIAGQHYAVEFHTTVKTMYTQL